MPRLRQRPSKTKQPKSDFPPKYGLHLYSTSPKRLLRAVLLMVLFSFRSTNGNLRQLLLSHEMSARCVTTAGFAPNTTNNVGPWVRFSPWSYLTLLAEMKHYKLKGPTADSAYERVLVGRIWRQSTREESVLNSSRDRNDGMHRGGDGGEAPTLCDPVYELLLGGRARVVLVW